MDAATNSIVLLTVAMLSMTLQAQLVPMFDMFSRRSPSWKVFDPSKAETLDEFLAANPPSRVLHSDHPWIYVPGIKGNIKVGDVEGLQFDWRVLDGQGRTTKEALNKIAVKRGVFAGKWLIYVNNYEVDAAWKRIAKAVHENGMGVAAKVSPYSPTDLEHCVCVYTSDFRNRTAIRELRQDLRQLGFNKVLEYKPDAYTHVGIYPNNKWDISEGLYSE